MQYADDFHDTVTFLSSPQRQHLKNFFKTPRLGHKKRRTYYQNEETKTYTFTSSCARILKFHISRVENYMQSPDNIENYETFYTRKKPLSKTFFLIFSQSKSLLAPARGKSKVLKYPHLNSTFTPVLRILKFHGVKKKNTASLEFSHTFSFRVNTVTYTFLAANMHPRPPGSVTP